ncbi:EamA family transporter [Flexivirga oryzae]|uniref:Threonine/homoserine efflux transporter RhtA n=1 Tax=Flexivirga oryzae TaxID=1794944 RepID=A0A839N7M5_9MICO|nr:threonine/homoserine efflux transporter RhtA [Flexivirga oryzae]
MRATWRRAASPWRVVALGGGTVQVTSAGLASGLVTAAAFAAYVLLQARTGSPDLSRLALAFVVATLVDLPLILPAVPDLSATVTCRVLASALVGVAAAYSLDAFAIHRLGARQAGVLLALDPAVGALSGRLVLGQSLTTMTWAGMGLVMTAGVLAAGSDSSPAAAE